MKKAAAIMFAESNLWLVTFFLQFDTCYNESLNDIIYAIEAHSCIAKLISFDPKALKPLIKCSSLVQPLLQAVVSVQNVISGQNVGLQSICVLLSSTFILQNDKHHIAGFCHTCAQVHAMQLLGETGCSNK